MRLKQAVLEFLANELHLEVSALNEESTFAELGVDETYQADLLERLQESLGIILPEEKASSIATIGDLLDAVEEQEEGE